MSPDCIGPGAGERVDGCARVGAEAVNALGAGQEDTAEVIDAAMAGQAMRAAALWPRRDPVLVYAVPIKGWGQGLRSVLRELELQETGVFPAADQIGPDWANGRAAREGCCPWRGDGRGLLLPRGPSGS